MKKEKNTERTAIIKNSKAVIARLAMAVMTFYFLFMASGFYSYADTRDIGKNAGNWILDQIFWVGLVVLAIGLVGCLIKKAWVAAIILFIAGGAILIAIKSPEMATNLGETLVHDVLGL